MSGEVNMIPTLRKIRGGSPTKFAWNGPPLSVGIILTSPDTFLTLFDQGGGGGGSLGL